MNEMPEKNEILQQKCKKYISTQTEMSHKMSQKLTCQKYKKYKKIRSHKKRNVSKTKKSQILKNLQ